MRTALLRQLAIVVVALLSAACGEGVNPSPSVVAPPSLAPTPEIRAAMDLASAQTLERSRKTKQALDAYRQIIEQYPDSPQAKVAREHAEKLGSK